MPVHIVLHEPEIPQNTGSIGRTCMAIGARLHLIEPLGFSLENKYLKRAGLDYWKDLALEIHPNWTHFQKTYPLTPPWFFTTKANHIYTEAQWEEEPFLVFGKETAGIPHHILHSYPDRCLRIPLLGKARSLNLSVAVGIAAYDVMRQQDFHGLQQMANGLITRVPQ